MTQIHIDFAPTKECTNPDTYGEICVRCNDCGRFNKVITQSNNKENEQNKKSNN